ILPSSRLFSLLLKELKPQPTQSTLCPYTSLFRSRRHTAAFVGTVSELPRPVLPPAQDASLGYGARVSAPGRDRAHGSEDLPWLQDRQSTRLNSSHVKISYAVFCLKKKTAVGR